MEEGPESPRNTRPIRTISTRSLVTCYTGDVADYEKVIVYIRASDARSLKDEGKVPADWVRSLVKRAFEKRREST